MTVDNKNIDLTRIGLYTRREIHTVFRHLRDSDPIHLNRASDGNVFYALTRHEHVEEIAKDNVRFVSGRGTQIADKRAEGKGAQSVHNADGALHRQLRLAGQKALSRKLIESRRERMASIIGELIDKAPSDRSFDFVDAIAVKIPMVIFSELLGVPRNMQLQLVDWANTMSDVRASDEEQARCRSQLFDAFRELASEKRKNPADDIASALVHAPLDGEPMPDAYLDAFFMVLTVAGNETTRFLLAGGLEALLENPEQMNILRNQPDLVACAVEEMIRWVTPVVHMRRTAAEPLDLFGVPVPESSKVVLFFASGNRDERVFGDTAGHFDITRQHNPHMGFGRGAHFCLGAHLARMEASIFWTEFLRRELDVSLEGTAERLPSHWFSGLTKLDVRWS